MRCIKPAMLRSSACSMLLLTPAARAFSINSVPGVEAYTHMLATYPLETKVATAAALAVLGDALAQQREPGPWDKKRAASFVAFDAAYRGGFQHVAFPLIIDSCQGELLRGALTAAGISATLDGTMDVILPAVERTCLNQLILVPIVYYPLFFAITGAVQGLTAEQSLDRARANFVALTVRNWQFWIPAQLVQFALLPEEWQVPYTCAMGLVWNVILSAAAGNAVTDEGEAARVALPEVKEPSRAGVVVPTGLGRSEEGAVGAAGASRDASDEKKEL